MANSYTTHRRQLYILPTKAGWVFTLLVFLLFLASVKFSHQATFLLTFLLCGFGIISSFHTQKNINKITLSVKNAPAIFSGATTDFICRLHNPSDTKRHNVWILCSDHTSSSDIQANSTAKHTIKLTPTKRGLFELPAINITSHYPLGILFGWSRAFQSDATCLVYPQPKDLLSQPDSVLITSDEGQPQLSSTTSQQHNGEQISSLKPYQEGDRLRDIHWPSLAKTSQLVSKEYDNNTEFKRIFSWQQVSRLTTENKLSQLTFWLLQAEKKQTSYQLSIPGFTSEHAQGDAHLHDCLEKLATWEESDA